MSRIPEAQVVIETVRSSGRGPMKPKAIAKALGIPTDAYRELRTLLRSLEADGRLYRVKGGRYAAPDRISLVTGRLTTIRSGDGFVRSDEDGSEVFVPGRNLDSAMDGDRVVVRVESRPKGLKPIGRVIKVLERAHETLVGIFHEGRKVQYVVPLDAKISHDVTVPWGDEGEARDGEVVVVRVTHPGSRRHGPVGEIERVLGALDAPGVDVLSVLYAHGLSPDFPEGVLREVQETVARSGPGPEEGEEREDLRDLVLFTIDPSDAKDHDDALSWERTTDGVRIGIHIADVSWFVPAGGAVDREALDRGTSVYLVDRVVPMLPHALSSDLCSLRPEVDRRAVSLLIDLDDEGRVRGHRFLRSWIRSRAGLSYEQAQAILDGDAAQLEAAGEEVVEALRGLQARAEGLIQARADRGALDFDLPEARVELDGQGAPIRIVPVERLATHRLVEAFMLLANEIVAEEGDRRGLPVLYRIHERPSVEKVEQLRTVLGRLGIRLPPKIRRPGDLVGALAAAAGGPAERLVSTMVLRSMQRARYAAELEGHFGLALEHYAHFTSPIRRYPDLVTHRAVVRTLIDGEAPDPQVAEGLAGVAEHASWREQVATQAERDSVEMKKIEYLRRHLGDAFDGTISGVRAFGAFVQLDELLIDGLVHVNGLDDDYYEFDERSMALIGVRSGRVLRLGDRVRVQVSRVDKEERHVDLLLIGPAGSRDV